MSKSGLGGKWLGLLKEVMPGLRRAAVMFNPDTAPGGGNYFLQSFEVAARAFSVEPIVVPVRSVPEIEMMISLGDQGAGLVLETNSFLGTHHQEVIALAAREKVPAIFEPSFFVKSGGLLSYGIDYEDMFRHAAGHVDRILRGAKPADLPVEAPTKFVLTINLNTAKTLGLTIPETLLATADEVIQ